MADAVTSRMTIAIDQKGGGLRFRRLLLGQRALLSLPLLLFLIVIFIYPIGSMLVRSIKVDEIVTALPLTSRALATGAEAPSDQIFAALATDFRESSDADLASAGTVLNYFEPGLRSAMIEGGKLAKALSEGEMVAKLSSDRRWKKASVWTAVSKLSHQYSLAYFERIADFDLKGGSVSLGLYSSIYLRSFWMAIVVTVFSVLIGYPMAYSISKQSKFRASLLIFLVMIPFWTSLLARTASWLIIFQKNGPLNSVLLWTGISSEPLDILFSRTAVYVAMVQVMIPFIILPVYGLMKGVPPQQLRAAVSLGAHPIEAFWRVYVPQTVPAVASSALLVFTMSLGYYILPQLLGGPKDQMISYNIASQTLQTGNWGLSAALAMGLLLLAGLICGLYLALLGRRGIASN